MFRFSIRELMLVAVVVAMGLGWWLERGGPTRSKSRLNSFGPT